MTFLPLKWGIHLAKEGKIAHLAQSESETQHFLNATFEKTCRLESGIILSEPLRFVCPSANLFCRFIQE